MTELDDVARHLAAAGCVAAKAEAAELIAAARDGDELAAFVDRRCAGEPLAWIVGTIEFCGRVIRVDPGVYVPRWQSEPLARRAAELLPAQGVALDLCTGAGAIAGVLQAAAPAATVMATDVDPRAVACARRNGVDAHLGHLDGPLPARLLGTVDVIVAVVPYVPTDELAFLPPDVTAFEPHAALDGGAGGLEVLTDVVGRSTRWLRPGGWLLLELGGDQAPAVTEGMAAAGFVDIAVHRDDDGHDRAIEGRVVAPPSPRPSADTIRTVAGSGTHFGLTGLAVMGANLARNVAHHDIPIAVHNRTASRTERFMAEHGDEGPITGTASVEEFVAALERPRTVMVMVKAGAPVDAVIEELAPHLDEGDTIVDGGNSNFRDTQRRTRALAEQGLRFLGVGVSGGEEGALEGPSIMPGGDRQAYADVEHVLTTIAAQVDGTPCCTYVGPDGAGHYVKMVHNGIEYADIQLIAEAYDLLRHGVGLEVAEVAGVFEGWNQGDLDSFLIEITGIVLAKTDDATGRPLVDVIVDEAEQKGTGRWTAQDALELGIPLTTITEAVFARTLSARRAERARAAGLLAGPRPGDAAPLDRSFVDDVQRALYASKVVAYAQGFAQITAASEAEKWDVDLGQMATIWRGGCIIRAKFLDRIRAAYQDDPHTPNLLFVDYFRDAVADAQESWRRVVAVATERGVPVPAFSSALSWYDGYRRERGPANLVQGLRDYFGAHTYRRTDREGSFHTRWGQDGAEVRTDT